jgi:pimeloyl-ACP methyl ester carboxylesterase
VHRTTVLAGLLVALVLLVASRARAGNGAHATIAAPESRVVQLVAGALPVFAAPPPDRANARATFVYLHGVCGLTQNGCGHFEGAPGWLVCPQANTVCSNGGSAWGGSVEEKIAVVDAALAASRAQWPESRNAPVVLIGFSQGSYVAMDIARAQPGRFAGMLLLGADTGHAVDRLRAAHVPRVALVCGAYDMMFPIMRDTPRALAQSKSGVAAIFGSLGHVGHTYVAEDGTDDVLSQMLSWIVQDLSAGPGEAPIRVLG